MFNRKNKPKSLFFVEIGVVSLVIVIVMLVSCVIFCQQTSTSDKWKIQTEVNVSAPSDWVYDNWPLSFDMDKIFGVDKAYRP